MNTLTCSRAEDMDLVGWLMDPRAPEWDEFVNHYPWCLDCSTAVGRVNSLELALREVPTDMDWEHPPPSLLARHVGDGEPLAGTGPAMIEAHLANCVACRSELRALESFEFSKLQVSMEQPSSVDVAGARGETDAAEVPTSRDSEILSQTDPSRGTQWAPWQSLPSPVLGLSVLLMALAAILLLRGVFSDNIATTAERNVPTVAENIDDSHADEILLAAVLDLGPAAYTMPGTAEDMDWLRSQGETRSLGSQLPKIRAMAPSHAANTMQASPRLWWRLSDPTSSPIEFTLLESASKRTLVRLGMSGETAAGLHVVALADHGIVLDPGVLYEWWVSLILENGPIVTIPRSGGAIVRLEPAAAELADPSGSRTPEHWHVNAREGLWYESFDFIASLGERHPDSKPLIALRAALLAEVGLSDSE